MIRQKTRATKARRVAAGKAVVETRAPESAPRRGPGEDPVIWALSLVLTLLGLLVIFDAGFARSIASGDGPIPVEFRNQLLFTVVSVAIGFGVSRVRGSFWQGSAGFWMGVAGLGLVAVKVIGTELNGAQRWVKIGPISVQPAEFAKVATVLFLASVLASRKPWQEPSRIKDWADRLDRVWVPKLVRFMPALLVLFYVYLVEREPDLGTAAVIGATGYFMFAFGGITKKSLIAVSLAGTLLVGAFVAQEPYRMERVFNHVHRWEDDRIDDVGYQTVQSEIAMASGGILGSGPGTGKVKHMMPAATTDFIFATVAEEGGLIGVLFFLGTLGALIWRLWELGFRCATRFGQALCSGVALWLGLQASVNIMMANGTLPAIGIPFPFISSGGSSLIALWIALGLCQAAAMMPSREEGKSHANRSHRRGNRRARLSSARSR
ncbi:MAG: FtsW/RodA/SpoVE family cell cycle protein [Armatimonadetes bacterium]|nr:FtsW/RodA/SpoVE family cell cycle protein [Armatimonadota bacterium]